MACYTFAQLENYAKQGGFPAAMATVMAAIAMAESSGCDIKQVWCPTPGGGQHLCAYGETGWGLWQITPGNSYPDLAVDTALLNPVTNAKAAYLKYSEHNSLAPWTTYLSGAYTHYMPGGSLYTPEGNANAPGGGPRGGPPSNGPGDPGPGSGGIGGVIGGIGGAITSPITKIGNVIDCISNPVGCAQATATGWMSAVLPWVLIVGIIFFALFMLGHALQESPAGQNATRAAEVAAAA